MMTFCPHCGRIVPDGQRCDCRPRPKRKPTKGDATRRQREPWRASYGNRTYQKHRQQAIARTNGCCAVCGCRCAYHDGSRWLTAGMGGEVHHRKALCEGGGNDAANLMLVCKRCHKRLDDARRKRTD